MGGLGPSQLYPRLTAHPLAEETHFMASTKTFEKDGETREAYTVADEVQLQFDGWKPKKPVKAAEKDDKPDSKATK